MLKSTIEKVQEICEGWGCPKDQDGLKWLHKHCSSLRNTERDIIICDNCEGSGIIQKSELSNYHKSEYRSWQEVCLSCQGSGRILKNVVTFKVPYNPDPLP